MSDLIYMSGYINVKDLATFLLVCSHAYVLALVRFEIEFVDCDLQLHESLCLLIQTIFFCFADQSKKKPDIKIFYTKTLQIDNRVLKSGHRTFYNILHKQDKMTYTVPRFNPYIYLFARQKNNEEGKRDLSSWRRKISFMCKCGGEKKENNNEEISLEEMKQRRRKEG